MNKNENWLKFVITGSVKDYLNYKEKAENTQLKRGEGSAYCNGRSCDKRNEHTG